MTTHSRSTLSHARRQSKSLKMLVALLATAGLTFVPGALTAFADDTAPSTTQQNSAEALVGEPAPEVSAVELAPATESTPAEEPAAAEDPAPAPGTEVPPTDAGTPAAIETPVVEESMVADDEVMEEDAAPAPGGTVDDPATSARTTTGDDNPHNKIAICHATGKPGKWVSLSPNGNAIFKRGHDVHQDGRDIIPPFEYKDDGVMKSFPGLNWDETGRAIYENECMKPPPPIEMLGICHLVDSESMTFEWLYVSQKDALVHAKNDSFDVIPDFIYDNGKRVYEFPGQNYDAAGRAFLEAGCVDEMLTPTIEVMVNQCAAPAYEVPGTVMITARSLMPGYEYLVTVTGPNGFTDSRWFTAESDMQSFEQAIPGAGDYVADVVSEMPPAMTDRSESNWQVWASVDFTVNPDCAAVLPPTPPAPPAPAATVAHPVVRVSTPMLATTGADESGTGFATVLLILSGSALLLVSGARRVLRIRD